jgi:perosamine synthetase
LPAVLLALGSCSEALELVPLVAALAAAGEAFEVAWFGDAHVLAEARQLGFTAPVRSHDGAADAFAAELLASSWSSVVLAGHGRWAPVLGHAARARGLPVLRLGAGVRTHAGDVDAKRRAADLAADVFAVATDWQRQELLREGVAAARIHVVGRLLATAVARADAAAAHVWIALEHADLGDPRWRQRWPALLAAAGTKQVLAAPTRPWLSLADEARRAGIALADDADARGQLELARTAACIVTDSAGYQELAAVLGIPCLAPAEHGAVAELIAVHQVALFDGANELQRAFAAQLARSPSPAAGAPNAATAIVGVLRTLSMAAVTPSLPSDGDWSGRTLGSDEIAMAAEALRRGTLNSTRGTFVTAFERQFAAWLGSKHAIACASGSAAMHVAIACLGLSAGDEVVTTPITDMGALIPILYEGGIPVFADVDPITLNVTAATIAEQLTPRTKAIVATHLFGRPCELDAIRALAEQRGLPLIEDAAQAFGARWRDRRIGCFGTLAAFSLQQGKHITTGEGGIVATDDDALARRAFLFVNKAWGYGDARPDHYFPALNYRLTELQGAVALAQLPKLDGVVTARRLVAGQLRQRLAAVPGLGLPSDPEHGQHAWWKFAFRVDANVVPGGASALGKRMQQAGIACVPRYIQKPAFDCEVFRDWRRSPISSLPLTRSERANAAMPFGGGDYAGARQGLEQVVVLPINERYTEAHVQQVATAINDAARELSRGGAMHA